MAITPQRVLRDYLLIALAALGGSAMKRDALDWVDDRFGHTLSDEDRLSQPTRDEAKWENQTAWERNRMVKDGLIEPFVSGTTVAGRWTLTDAGRRAAAPISAAVEPDATNDTAGPTSGQTRTQDPVRRKKIEDAAQERLMAVFRADGWEVVDTRVGHPYDARASKGDIVLYLEAKGTTTGGEHVIVTRNEVQWARAHRGECVIGIWSGMEFDAVGGVVATSGEFRRFDWSPDANELDPIQYDWTPNPAKLISTRS